MSQNTTEYHIIPQNTTVIPEQQEINTINLHITIYVYIVMVANKSEMFEIKHKLFMWQYSTSSYSNYINIGLFFEILSENNFHIYMNTN